MSRDGRYAAGAWMRRSGEWAFTRLILIKEESITVRHYHDCIISGSLNPVLYVFGRWNPSDIIKLTLPTVYYVPCDGQDKADKILRTLQRFGVNEGDVVELAGIEGLKGYVGLYYRLKEFDLYEFPIHAHKLLQDWNIKE